jgi:hypothetical protein
MDRKAPRFSRRFVSIDPWTAFNHKHEVGVKWKGGKPGRALVSTGVFISPGRMQLARMPFWIATWRAGKIGPH